jgi:hypothetical protein
MSQNKDYFVFPSRMVFCRSQCFSLSQQIRYLHRSAVLLARGIRRSNEPPPHPSSSLTNSDKKLSIDEENDQLSVQEQFARLELQRLEQESRKNGNESNSFVDEENQDLENDEQNLSNVSIDPSTTSIILFPGQGTQFVGMG